MTQPNLLRPRAFTLIELLVVITIIVVLLALLTPALDKAVYQAQLAVCGSNLKGIGTGVQVYATESRRMYPHRPYLRPNMANQSMTKIGAGNAAQDTRPLLRPYMSINEQLLCPLTPSKVDFEASKSTTQVHSTYPLFFGVQYKNERTAQPETGMFRLGDRLEYDGDRYTTLAVDNDNLHKGNLAGGTTSHLDRDGVGLPQVVQDEPPGGSGNDFTFSRWIYPTWERPPIDTQYVLDDGSVGRYEQVTWDEAEPNGRNRMAKVPLYSSAQNYNNGTEWFHMPKR